MLNYVSRLKLISFSIIGFALSTITCFAQVDFLMVSNPPGAVTDHSLTLVWSDGDPIPENHKFSVIQDGKTIEKTKKNYFALKCLSADSLYQFEIILQNANDEIINKSNLIRVRTKPLGMISNITDFGAVGDENTLNTMAIQRAIDECPKNGVVHIPKGVYRSGALFFKSNMTLHLDKDAVLKGSTNLADYPIVIARFEGTEGKQYASLINGGTLSGEGIQNFSIRGEGSIDAEGEKLCVLEMAEEKGKRGRILNIMNGEKFM